MSGCCEMITFKEDKYLDVFKIHITLFEKFNEMTFKLDLLLKLILQVYEKGWYISTIWSISTHVLGIQFACWDSSSYYNNYRWGKNWQFPLMYF